jgi:hypothetical protein
MPQNHRIFVASPGDVSAEREALARVVEEINQTYGVPLGYTLELVRWETHVAPGAGRPQQVINDQIARYDTFSSLPHIRPSTNLAKISRASILSFLSIVGCRYCGERYT